MHTLVGKTKRRRSHHEAAHPPQRAVNVPSLQAGPAWRPRPQSPFGGARSHAHAKRAMPWQHACPLCSAAQHRTRDPHTAGPLRRPPQRRLGVPRPAHVRISQLLQVRNLCASRKKLMGSSEALQAAAVLQCEAWHTTRARAREHKTATSRSCPWRNMGGRHLFKAVHEQDVDRAATEGTSSRSLGVQPLLDAVVAASTPPSAICFKRPDLPARGHAPEQVVAAHYSRRP